MAAFTKNDWAEGHAWGVNAICADASGSEELKAAPTGGQSLFLKKFMFDSGEPSLSFTLFDGTTAIIGPIVFDDPVGAPVIYELETPIKLTKETALNCTATAGNVHVIVEGFTI